MTTTTEDHTTTMDAIVRDAYGAPDTLELRRVATPTIADDEVLVRVRAAGVDRGVWHLTTGLPYPVRLAGYGVRRPKDPVIGTDVAGTVEAVGRDVTRFRAGDEVFGTGRGSFAELVAAREDRLVPKPTDLTFEEAAAVPTSALTALQAVRDQAEVERGQQVLVIGASGGVGTYAVQIAKAAGARVTGVCSSAKTDIVRAAGADDVIAYDTDDFTAAGRRYDVILDVGGHSPLSRLRRALTREGRLVIVGSETGGRWLGGFDRTLRSALLSPFVSQDLGGPWVCSESHEDLVTLAGLIEAGTVAPVLDRTFPLGRAGAAIAYLHDGHVRGKVVVTA